MTRREQQEAGAKLFALRMDSRISQAEAAKRAGIQPKDYIPCLECFLNSPITLQAELWGKINLLTRNF
jgi:hypothetical protein